MKKTFIHDISANSLQVIINQFCGLLVFYILSAWLGKNNFGEINWTLAVLLTSFNILSFGMDQVTVKKIAAGSAAGHLFSLYATHVLIAGAAFYGLLLLCKVIFPGFFLHHQLLLLLGIGKLIFFFSSPFKQVATGLEKFRPLIYMSVCSNIVRSLALLTLALLQQLDLNNVIIIFIAGDAAELILCYFVSKHLLKIPLHLRFNREGYRQLIKESLPQVGVVIFTSAIARFDWILLGILASNIVLAEYSFAWKVFEMAMLPLIVIAPVLITRFTKIFSGRAADVHPGKMNDLLVLLKVEMIIASLMAMILTICWVPVIDWITQGRYGSVNRYTIFILATGMPLLYFNNFLWTINFSRGALQMIFRVILVTFLVNILGDVILIPYLAAEGAAIAYLLAIVVQSALFLQKTTIEPIQRNMFQLLLVPAYTMCGSLAATSIFQQWWLALPTAVFFFGTLLFFTRQSINKDWLVFRSIAGI